MRTERKPKGRKRLEKRGKMKVVTSQETMVENYIGICQLTVHHGSAVSSRIVL